MVTTRLVQLLRASLVLALLSLAFPSMGISADRPAPTGNEEEESITKGVEAVLADAKALALATLSMDRYDALKLGGAVGIVGGLIAVDHPIQTFVQRNTTSSGTDTANRISDWLGAGPLLGYTAAAIAIGVTNESYGGSSRLKEAGLVSFEAEGFAIAATSMLKFLTGRARPDSNQGATHFRPFTGLDTSFASTTAATSFAMATVVAERYSGAGWVAYPLAGAVSAARVYTDKHFTSDVVAGALIGYGLGHFINRQNTGDPKDWQIRSMAMERGIGGGIMIGKKF